MKAKIGLGRNLNVHYKLYDASGAPKKFFRANALGNFIRNKTGYDLQIPLVLGSYGVEMNRSNLITNAGAAAVAGLIGGVGSVAIFDNIGIGTGATGAVAGNTALATEVNLGGSTTTNHLTATVTRVTTDVTNDTTQLVRTFNMTGTAAIVESGVFNAEAGGTMLARQTFSAINVISGDSIAITWKIDVD
ncbi:MAG: hypothetical protein A2728_00370 [Candidatus Spechtbacteria bacterium RIFCSPHIGHO2_01_FULL_38_11]|nr:MAG: hypothetical protein A2728_00370 [Candidatus Spechtbacteria bacterium RIFCSPHIGHO2_01_FULL_38_11]